MSDAVDLHEGTECVPGRMPEKWKDDHEANEQRPSSQHHIASDQRGPQKHRAGVQTHGPHACSNRKDKEPGSATSVGLHLHPLFTTASPKGPGLFRVPVAE